MNANTELALYLSTACGVVVTVLALLIRDSVPRAIGVVAGIFLLLSGVLPFHDGAWSDMVDVLVEAPLAMVAFVLLGAMVLTLPKAGERSWG